MIVGGDVLVVVYVTVGVRVGVGANSDPEVGRKRLNRHAMTPAATRRNMNRPVIRRRSFMRKLHCFAVAAPGYRSPQPTAPEINMFTAMSTTAIKYNTMDA